jgi:hypothetical protein
LLSGEDYSIFELFSIGKLHGSGPRLVDHGGSWIGVGDDLARARPNGCSGARPLASDGATERVEHGVSVSGLTGRSRWRGDQATVVEVLSAGSTWAWRDEKEDRERCGGGQ